MELTTEQIVQRWYHIFINVLPEVLVIKEDNGDVQRYMEESRPWRLIRPEFILKIMDIIKSSANNNPEKGFPYGVVTELFLQWRFFKSPTVSRSSEMPWASIYDQLKCFLRLEGDLYSMFANQQAKFFVSMNGLEFIIHRLSLMNGHPCACVKKCFSCKKFVSIHEDPVKLRAFYDRNDDSLKLVVDFARCLYHLQSIDKRVLKASSIEMVSSRRMFCNFAIDHIVARIKNLTSSTDLICRAEYTTLKRCIDKIIEDNYFNTQPPFEQEQGEPSAEDSDAIEDAIEDAIDEVDKDEFPRPPSRRGHVLFKEEEKEIENTEEMSSSPSSSENGSFTLFLKTLVGAQKQEIKDSDAGIKDKVVLTAQERETAMEFIKDANKAFGHIKTASPEVIAFVKMVMSFCIFKTERHSFKGRHCRELKKHINNHNGLFRAINEKIHKIEQGDMCILNTSRDNESKDEEIKSLRAEVNNLKNYVLQLQSSLLQHTLPDIGKKRKRDEEEVKIKVEEEETKGDN